MASRAATDQSPATEQSVSPQSLPPPVGPCGHVLSGPTAYVGPCGYCDLYDNVRRAADEMSELLPEITRHEGEAVKDNEVYRMYRGEKETWKERRIELANYVYHKYGTYGNSEHCEPEAVVEQAENDAFERHEEVSALESSDNAQTAEAEATNTSAPSQPTINNSTVQRPPVTFAALADVDHGGEQLQHRPEDSYRKMGEFQRETERYEPGRWSSTTEEGLQNRSGEGIDGWAEYENDNWHLEDE